MVTISRRNCRVSAVSAASVSRGGSAMAKDKRIRRKVIGGRRCSSISTTRSQEALHAHSSSSIVRMPRG